MREHSCKAMGENIKLVNWKGGWEWRRWYVGKWRYENDLLCFGIIDTEKVYCPLCKKQFLERRRVPPGSYKRARGVLKWDGEPSEVTIRRQRDAE